jgi:hypothetical protein
MAGKGSWRRPTDDWEKYRDNHDNIFKKKETPKETPKDSEKRSTEKDKT